MPSGKITLLIHGIEIFSQTYANAKERRLTIWMWKSMYKHMSYTIKPDNVVYPDIWHLSPHAKNLMKRAELKTEIMQGDDLISSLSELTTEKLTA